jgi:rSAM/selenodomain-associated transferase 1
MQSTLLRKPSQALLIFTRNPEPGKCKTRLAASIGDQSALDVYRFLLTHTARIATEVEKTDKFVYFSEHVGDGSFWDPSVFHFRLQSGEELGSRMRNAFREAFTLGYTSVIIIGSDLYDLTPEDLREAFKRLDEHEVVLGPASDGGYYLLGLKVLIPELFENKAWGMDTVLEATLTDLEGRDTFVLPVRNDVDRYEDIAGNPIFESIINRADE